jgi:hypothetical protein
VHSPRKRIGTDEGAFDASGCAVQTRDDLADQERQIEQLARHGLSNLEVGAVGGCPACLRRKAQPTLLEAEPTRRETEHRVQPHRGAIKRHRAEPLLTKSWVPRSPIGSHPRSGQLDRRHPEPAGNHRRGTTEAPTPKHEFSTDPAGRQLAVSMKKDALSSPVSEP